MKRVLITGAGGSPSTNFVRSLRKAPEDFYIVGTDADKYTLMRAETDARYLVPSVTDPQYKDIVNKVIDNERIEFIHAQNDAEVYFLSTNRDSIHANVFLPDDVTVQICRDKFQSFQKWQDAGLKVPETRVIKTKDDLVDAFKEFGGHFWIRATVGAAGRGSLPAHDIETAENWLDFQRGWDGTFTASELLEKDTITWMSIWHEGELVVAQGRKRLYWELARLAPSGVTGLTGGGETVSDPVLDEIAQQAVLTIDKKPHGLFGVDLTYDKDGVPNPTEINIGRFFTTHQFFTELGLNMPYIFTKLAYGEEPPAIEKKLNPVNNQMVWIRGMDFEPVLVSTDEIEHEEKKLEALRKEVTSS